MGGMDPNSGSQSGDGASPLAQLSLVSGTSRLNWELELSGLVVDLVLACFSVIGVFGKDEM